MGEMVWIINKGSQDLEIIDMDAHKWVILKPGRPQQVTRTFALNNIGRYIDIKACDNPETYFINDKLKQLIIRDAGIGDLLLLEPIIRELSKTREITIKTKFPDIYKNNPHITKIINLDEKHNTEDFDTWEDLRNYSEIAASRNVKHRTDVYNEKFNVNIENKEPRIYFNSEDKPPIIKKDGCTYFTIQCDASHGYRKFSKGEELAKYIISKDKNNIVILLGNTRFIKLQHQYNNIIDMQGKTTLRECIKIIYQSDYFIGGDSGLLHVACALHVPSIGLFSIISPDLRLKYYTGKYKALYKDNLKCIGCGNTHMEVCNFGNIKNDPKFIPPCLDIEPELIYNEALNLGKEDNKKYYINETKEKEPPKLNVIKNIKLKLTMPIIVQDEEINLPRFIELVMSHPAIGRVIAIDGGSKDNTVNLLKKAGAEVYIHPYIKTYHDQQAMQRNISCSYIANGTPIFIMDIDECFSKELSNYLYFLAEQKEKKYGLVYRRTFNYYNDINDPNKQIKDYPDPQPRYYIWDEKFKFVGGAHHKTLNCPNPFIIDKPIIHFEKEGKNRDKLEQQWKSMMEGVKKYGN